jgi:hypothetical protein
MRKFGLILENLDGFDVPPKNPPVKFVMRGVPHTLGLSVSLDPGPDPGPPPLPPGTPTEMTGWSGDGSPGSGSLREFAIGAVTQHFTRNLERMAGRDFTLPSEHQLDAMEAFQLSLGRDADFNLANITFTDGVSGDVTIGKGLFINGGSDPTNFGGKCAGCHNNAGALLGGVNRNINTNVEDVVHPARAVVNFPIDGGFGQTPANANGSFGDGTFNLASVVEAADTPPFFHNNVVNTLEEVVTLYTGDEFNGPRQPNARFSFTDTQKGQIADFMRAVNTL